jgi:predicted alpha/beta hydrolase family esterase
VLTAQTESRVLAAHGDVSSARVRTDACRAVPWVSSSADAFRTSVDALVTDLRRCERSLDDVVACAATARRAAGFVAARGAGCAWFGGTPADLPWASWPTSGCGVLRVGGGAFVSVDPVVLGQAAARLVEVGVVLRRAGTALDVVDAELQVAGSPAGAGADSSGVGSSGTGDVAAAEHALRVALADLRYGPVRPEALATRCDSLAASLRSAAAVAAQGDSGAGDVARALAAAEGAVLGANPFALLGLGAGGLLAASVAMRSGMLTGTGGGPSDAEALAIGLTGSGGVEVTLTALAAALRGALPGAALPSPDPVGDLTLLLALVAASRNRPAALVPIVDPPQLAPPGDLAGLVGVVAASYDDGTPTGVDGTPPATVTVQRLEHPDGTVSWVVAIPGMRSGALGGDVPTDNQTNLELAAGLPDDMTTQVIEAMQAAGIGADEPVVLAGHSQGGMTAMAVAAATAGMYTIAGVVTAGSPNVPSATPAGVPVVRIEHDEDAVPQLDGEPTTVGPDVTVVGRSLGDDGPVSFSSAHQVSTYQETAALVDEATAQSPGSAPGVQRVLDALGPDGTTATTTQYQVTRDPAAFVDPATGLPYPPVIEAVP